VAPPKTAPPYARTLALLERRPYWRAVGAMARALVQYKTVSGRWRGLWYSDRLTEMATIFQKAPRVRLRLGIIK
jgi:hypothetical protein